VKSRETRTDPDNGTEYTVTTNNRWRWPVGWADLTRTERDEFSYLHTPYQQQEAEFVRCYGWVYHTAEVGCTDLPGWDGLNNDSLFSATVFKVNEDGQWMTGRLTC
jgi:hypothetical protein